MAKQKKTGSQSSDDRRRCRQHLYKYQCCCTVGYILQISICSTYYVLPSTIYFIFVMENCSVNSSFMKKTKIIHVLCHIVSVYFLEACQATWHL